VSGRRSWDDVLDEMLVELAQGAPRAETYWAQQLAFGPVLVHALGLRHSRRPPGAEEGRLLAPCLRLARAALGAIPELPGVDPTGLRLLALRQARAIGWGRRSTLARRLRQIGLLPEDGTEFVPSRMVRPYRLIGFRPGERFPG
jgi:hypothetical protein